MEADTVRADSIIGHFGAKSAMITVKKYDFTRPDKFSKDQIQTVALLHETFARLASTSMSAMLRSLVHLRVSLVDQLTYEEFIRQVPNPTTFAIINMDPLKGSAIFEIDPNITFAIINRLFGGQDGGPKYHRDLTDIETSVMDGLMIRILANLRESWSTVLDLRPRLGQIETNPMFAQIVPPNEMVILVSFDITVGETNGKLNFCIPYLTIEPIIEKLTSKYWYSSARRKPGNRFESRAAQLKADSTLFFETEKLSLRDIFRLKKGDLVKLTDPHTAFLAAGGKPVARFDVSEKNGRFVFVPIEDLESALSPGINIRGEKEKRSANESEDNESVLMRAISSELSKGISAMTGRMEKLEKMSSELADLVAYGPGRGEQSTGESQVILSGKPFSFLRSYEAGNIAAFLEQEHVQTIALILTFLEPDLGSGILRNLPEEIQPVVAVKIATIQACHPEVISAVEKVLKRKLLILAEKTESSMDGIASIVDILQVADRKLEKTVIEMLEKTNPEIAEQAKLRMFVFEDTTHLDKTVIKLLMDRMDRQDLLLALKATDEKTKQHFFSCMDMKARAEFETDLAKLGPIRLSRVEEAQARIIRKLKELEESGEIEIARFGEEIVD